MNDITINIEEPIKELTKEPNREIEIYNAEVKEISKDTVAIDVEANTAEYEEGEDERPSSKNGETVNMNDGRSTDRNIGKDNIPRLFGGNSPGKTTWVQYNYGMGGQTPVYASPPLNYEPRSRNQFVKRVLIIVFIMLMVTAGFNAIVFATPSLKSTFLRIGFILAIPALILMVGLNYAIACSPCARQVPCNMIILVLAVIGMSVICAFITVRYETRIILYAVLATGAVVFVCILLACSSFDFTQWLLYVIVISVAFCAIAMIASLAMVLTGTYMTIVQLIILIVGTILNVMILTIELQTILGGRAVELSEDEYALGAFLLYTSIVDIFLKMVQILGIFDDM